MSTNDRVNCPTLAYRCTRSIAVLLILTLIAPVNAANFLAGLEAYLLEEDFAVALREWRPLAEGDHAEAQFYLGTMYASGKGVPQNDAEAVKWYLAAAEQGHADAQDRLRIIQDRLRIIDAAQKAFQAGVEAYARGDFTVAQREWGLLAEQGYAEAQFRLGFLYEFGKGVPQNDAEAVNWYRKAAEQGHDNAQFSLGVMYEFGKGVPQHNTEAVKWYRQAAEQDLAIAQVALGLMYDHGKGVPQHDTEAVKWYRKAAEQGHAEAQFSLGLMYALGRGVLEDDVHAYAWFNIAAAQGVKGAEESKKLAAEYMNHEEIARAQRLAQQYWEAYVRPFGN